MQLEELGQRGEVEGAQVLLREVEALERERERERVGRIRDSSKVRVLTTCCGTCFNMQISLQTLAGFEVDANDFHEKMELCDVCGSFLVIGDSQSRVDAHLLGKQHLGYARIRAAITELKVAYHYFHRFIQLAAVQYLICMSYRGCVVVSVFYIEH